MVYITGTNVKITCHLRLRQRSHMKTIIIILLLTSFYNAYAGSNFLESFKLNPEKAYFEMPEKHGPSADEEFLRLKQKACRRDSVRKDIIDAGKSAQTGGLELFSPQSLGNERQAIEFVELPAGEVITNIYELDKSLKFGQVSVQPWSGDYWSIQSGMAAKRYVDKNSNRFNWKASYEYFLANPTLSTEPEFWSAAEKYDFIVGDEEFSLTHANWLEGKAYHDAHGRVEGWMGICHGWAAASFMEPRPTHSINMNSYFDDTQSVELLPDDIKALLSLKWAKGTTVNKDYSGLATSFVGGRCNDKEAESDPETGRVIDPKCFDVNPATWHIIVTNQVGQVKRPFIIDAAYDYEVWNHPVVSYQVNYFNPKDLSEVETLEQAKVAIGADDFKDKFAKFRNNPKAKHLVGIRMEVKYVVETSPLNRGTDSSENDMLNKVAYYYDLELDETGKIIGGEWYQRSHPDFVWMPKKDSVVLNNEDLYVNNVNDVLSIAPVASRRSTVPLKFVMDAIMTNFKPSPIR